MGGILRLAGGLYATDLDHGYYWEYGEIGKNLLHSRGYSFFYYDNEGDTLAHRFDENIESLPSAYMPPGYVGFLLLVPGDTVRTILILIVQTLLGVLALYLLYRLGVTCFSLGLTMLAIVSIRGEFGLFILLYLLLMLRRRRV